ncbi:hypothetical protein HK096_006909, partial [Nowakowskiella sp. JEL0078]
ATRDTSGDFTSNKKAEFTLPESTKIFSDSEIKREFELTTDTWKAPGIDFKIISPIKRIPDPDLPNTTQEALKRTLLPAVFAQVTVDNLESDLPRRAIFGYQNPSDGRVLDNFLHLAGPTNNELIGFQHGGKVAIVACGWQETKDGQFTSGGSDTFVPEEVKTATSFGLDQIFRTANNIEDNWGFGLGQCTLNVVTAPPRSKRTYTFAICFFRQQHHTLGIDTGFYYTKYFETVIDVAKFAKDNHESLVAEWTIPEIGGLIDNAKLNKYQRFQLIHAVRAYYGSTELLLTLKDAQGIKAGRPVWVVNEGEYRMMNTCDLMLDHSFFECVMNRWVLKNILDFYVDRYSYYDKVFIPDDPNTFYEGGISFAHDQGIADIFTRAGRSSYELVKLDDCFSFMTSEELLNWVLGAGVYVGFKPLAEGFNNQGRDDDDQEKLLDWAKSKKDIITACFNSLKNRDHPFDKTKRNGMINVESDKTKGGAEITTYDSLDPSLARTRQNIYIGGKCFAAYLTLSHLFTLLEEKDLVVEALDQAALAAETISNAYEEDTQSIPAIIGSRSGPGAARIIPAIEGLALPFVSGVSLQYFEFASSANPKFAKYINVLQQHTKTILKKGICIFDDNGWKLSSTSINSWLSKIYLNQFVARKILKIETHEEHDIAHVKWLTEVGENGYWAWSDQIFAGVAEGSLYYPRGVTSILWCFE